MPSEQLASLKSDTENEEFSPPMKFSRSYNSDFFPIRKKIEKHLKLKDLFNIRASNKKYLS